MPRKSTVKKLPRKPTMRRLVGKGDYAIKGSKKGDKSRGRNTFGKTAGSLLGSLAGGALLGPEGISLGSSMGRKIGSTAQKLFRSLTGMGDYEVKTNTILGSSDPPIMHAGPGMGEIRIRHREFIRDIISSATANTFQTFSCAINPGAQSAFPWLSPIAQQFQEWSPAGIVFEFISKSSDALNSVNTALGSVILATEYNANQPIFISKLQMENSQYCSTVKPSQSCMHAIECDPRQMVMESLYIQKPTTSTNDLRFQNLGNFVIATSGFQGTSVNCGELWVTYDIVLRKSILYQRGANLGDHWELPATVSTSDYFGFATASLQTSSNLGTSLTATTIKFPSGFSGIVSVTYRTFGISAALTAPTLTGSLGVSPLNIIQGDTLNNTLNSSVTSAVLEFTTYWSVVDPGNNVNPIITFSGGTFPTAPLGVGDLLIQTIQNDN